MVLMLLVISGLHETRVETHVGIPHFARGITL